MVGPAAACHDVFSGEVYCHRIFTHAHTESWMELASTPGVALRQNLWSWRGFEMWRISTLVDGIILLFRLHSPRTAWGRHFCVLPERRRRSSTQCDTSKGATSRCRLTTKFRRRLACRETKFDALLSERRSFACYPSGGRGFQRGLSDNTV